MEQQVEITKIESADVLAVNAKAELDMQVTTAKAYPRNLPQVLNNIATLACNDPDTAAECFYCLRRNGGESVIEGASTRLAEIVAYCWGNIRVEGAIVANDGKKITAEGTCWDLEQNTARRVQVQRRITDKNGRTFSEDMQIVTGNAAIAIATRNAVLKVVPKAILKRITDQIKQTAMGQAMDVETSRTNCLANFAKLGATQEMICHYLGVENVLQIGKEQILQLKGTFTAIKDGTTTCAEAIIAPYNEHLAELEKEKQANKLVEQMKQVKSSEEPKEKK